jgi:hypothetical protein
LSSSSCRTGPSGCSSRALSAQKSSSTPNAASTTRPAVALGDIIGDPVEVEAFARSATSEFESYSKLSKKVSREVRGAVRQIQDYVKLAHMAAFHLLETTAVMERLEKLLNLLDCEIAKGLRTHGRSSRERRNRASVRAGGRPVCKYAAIA